MNGDLRDLIAEAICDHEQWGVVDYSAAADAVLAVLRDTGHVEYRVVCADGTTWRDSYGDRRTRAEADRAYLNVLHEHPHRIESRVVVTLPWEQVTE